MNFECLWFEPHLQPAGFMIACLLSVIIIIIISNYVIINDICHKCYILFSQALPFVLLQDFLGIVACVTVF